MTASVQLKDATDESIAWGDGQTGFGSYVRMLAQMPVAALGNAQFTTHVLQLRDRGFCTIAPTAGDCWLTSLAATYGRASRDEIVREVNGVQAAAFNALSHVAEGLLRLGRADHAVYPNHLLFSTSLYGDWRGDDLAPALDALRAAFPDRAIIWRSLSNEDHSALVARMIEQGGRTLLSRIVWRIADPARDWVKRRDARDDRRLLELSGLRLETAHAPSDETLDRALGLYASLYRDKYSRTNPDYRSALLKTAIKTGMLNVHFIRNQADVIEGFTAEHIYQGTLVNPMLGYDRTLPQSRGLYRIAMAASAERAIAEGLAINYSAGASAFKRNRGAQPALEFSMIFDDHLPPTRRFAYRTLADALQAMAPMLERIALQ